MDKDYIIPIIGIVGTIAGTVVGFLLSICYESIKEKRAIKSLLQSAINEIKFVNIANNYPVALNKLRLLVIEHSNTITSKELLSFYNNWLNDPMIENGQPLLNLYTNEQKQKMLHELSKIKL